MNVDITGLTVKYKQNEKETVAIAGLDLHVNSGETLAVIGPSGCGKTTLLYVLSGIIRGFCGSALLGGYSVDPKRQHIGLIPQNCGLLEWADVYGNAALGIRTSRKIKPNRQHISAFLSQIGLGGFESKYPGTLSGGERQRVAIARAFLMKPDILLMDEPFSSLDAITREEMQDVFLRVWAENRTTAIIVTHSIEEALYLGKHIAFMTPAPGRIAEVMQNALFGKSDLRTSHSYYNSVAELKKRAGELWIDYEKAGR